MRRRRGRCHPVPKEMQDKLLMRQTATSEPHSNVNRVQRYAYYFNPSSGSLKFTRFNASAIRLIGTSWT